MPAALRMPPPGPSPNAPPRGKWAVLRFVALFALVMALFYAATLAPLYTDRIYPAIITANAEATAFLLGLLGESHVTTTGPVVSGPRFAMAIRRGCDAVEPIALLLAAIIAFPSKWKHKLWGVLAGAAFLVFMNLVRLVSLYYVGIHWPESFQFIHEGVWQTAFIFLVLIAWVVWVFLISRRPKSAATPKSDVATASRP